MSNFGHGSPNVNTNHQWYIGVYSQDAWRVRNKVTLNLGLRWDPYWTRCGKDGTISNFSTENFAPDPQHQFSGRARGLLYPGDEGFRRARPERRAGQWLNLSPRVGAAWDVGGTAVQRFVRPYALDYDFPGGAFQQVASTCHPFNRIVSVNLGSFRLRTPPSWWLRARPLHPVPIPVPLDAVFPSLAPYSPSSRTPTRFACNRGTLRSSNRSAPTGRWPQLPGQPYRSDLGAQADQRRHLPRPRAVHVERRQLRHVHDACEPAGSSRFDARGPGDRGFYSTVYTFTDIGLQDYRGLKLSFRRRSANGLTVSGNYTISHCTTDSPYGGRFVSDFEYTNPDDPTYDKGNCPFNRTHIVAFTLGYQTPRFDNTALRVVASDWRVSGVLNGQSGNWLTVTTGVDPAGTGIGGQRVNQVSDDVYGPQTKQPDAIVGYLDRAAFVVPARERYGRSRGAKYHGARLLERRPRPREAPACWATTTFEIRVETFNLFNNFNWGDPVTTWTPRSSGELRHRTAVRVSCSSL